jgi:hypothetical protein
LSGTFTIIRDRTTLKRLRKATGPNSPFAFRVSRWLIGRIR